MQCLKVRIRFVLSGNNKRNLWVQPVWRLVVRTQVLVQSIPLVLAAEPIVTGSAAVDVASFGAVEGGVKVSHHIKVAPKRQRSKVFEPPATPETGTGFWMDPVKN